MYLHFILRPMIGTDHSSMWFMHKRPALDIDTYCSHVSILLTTMLSERSKHATREKKSLVCQSTQLSSQSSKIYAVYLTLTQWNSSLAIMSFNPPGCQPDTRESTFGFTPHLKLDARQSKMFRNKTLLFGLKNCGARHGETSIKWTTTKQDKEMTKKNKEGW